MKLFLLLCCVLVVHSNTYYNQNCFYGLQCKFNCTITNFTTEQTHKWENDRHTVLAIKNLTTHSNTSECELTTPIDRNQNISLFVKQQDQNWTLITTYQVNTTYDIHVECAFNQNCTINCPLTKSHTRQFNYFKWITDNNTVEQNNLINNTDPNCDLVIQFVNQTIGEYYLLVRKNKTFHYFGLVTVHLKQFNLTADEELQSKKKHL